MSDAFAQPEWMSTSESHELYNFKQRSNLTQTDLLATDLGGHQNRDAIVHGPLSYLEFLSQPYFHR